MPGAGLDELLRPDQVLSPWWREVLLLYSAIGPDDDSSEPDATKFFRRLADPEADDVPQRRLRLAALARAEATNRVDPAIHGDLMARLLRVRTYNERHTLPDAATSKLGEYLLGWAKVEPWYSAAAITWARQRPGDAARRTAQVLQALESPEPIVRIAGLYAAAVLKETDDPGAFRDRALALSREGEPVIRRVALFCLRNLAFSDNSATTLEVAAPRLLEALKDADHSIVDQACKEIVALADRWPDPQGALDAIHAAAVDRPSRLYHGQAIEAALRLARDDSQLGRVVDWAADYLLTDSPPYVLFYSSNLDDRGRVVAAKILERLRDGEAGRRIGWLRGLVSLLDFPPHDFSFDELHEPILRYLGDPLSVALRRKVFRSL
jgi:hypothetical protein